MKYLSPYKDGGWDHRPYWEYLDSVQGVMPAHLYEFASNPENHNLTSPNSLHDSWLKHWRIEEVAIDGDERSRRLQIVACVLGPMHDRLIFLTYKNVTNYSVQRSSTDCGVPLNTPHGDLLVHELAMVSQGLFCHEIVFSRGLTFSVEFEDMDHRIELITASWVLLLKKWLRCLWVK